MTAHHGKVGPYSLARLLATGSQSQVWQADGPEGVVALKVARTEAHHAALEREAAILASADHPGLPTCLAVADDFGWLALEHIQGSQIDQWAQVQDIEEVIEAALQLLDVLDWLHQRGLVHGDVKPSNVLVDTEGRVKLIDLGVAGAPDEWPEGFTGTLGYAAPELLQGHKPSIPASDLYGVGALFYTCLTGRPPFVAADPAALTYLPLVSLPAPATAANPDLPTALDHLLLDLLARRPERRPPSLDAVRERLRSCADSPPPTPLLGMAEEREILRRAVVGAADGEPRVVVVYGPPGSGRRTLLSEAIGFARREGLDYHKGSDIRALLEAIKSGEGRVAAVLRGTSKNAQKLASLVLREGLPCLLLLHADRPLPGLAAKGAILCTPAPLSQLDVTRLARALHADEDLAGEWWRDSLGLPIAVLGRIRAWRREELGDELSLDHLPPESRQILQALDEGEPVGVTELARRTRQSENRLLDHCEVLFAEKLILPEDEGASIRLAEGVRR